MRSAGSAEVLAFFSGGALLVALLWAQLFLFRRTRRVFNVPLLVASVLALTFTIYLLARFGDARADLRVAKDDAFESIHALFKARATAYDANGDESRYLLDRDREQLYETAYANKVRLLSTAPDFPPASRSQVATLRPGQHVLFQGYFADEFNNLTFGGEREAATTMAATFATYYKTDGDIRKLVRMKDDVSRRAALALCLGRSNDEFDRFDRALMQVIKINRDEFDTVLTHADGALRTAEWLDPLFAIAIALLGWLGIRARLREYA
jgi:hypothetical protein